MSTSLYSPDEGATLEGLDYIKILSQRDLSSQIPINFVTIPGVSLRAACFPFGRYGASAAAKCFSNLLATGFRRLDVDLYWDASRATWSFCPVELGVVNPTLSSTQAATVSSISSSSASLNTGALTAAEQSPGMGMVPAARTLQHRQDSSSASSRTSTPLPMSSDISLSSISTIPTPDTTISIPSSSIAATTTSGVDPPSFEDVDGETLIRIGEYACAPALDFRLLLNVLEGHLQKTEDSLNATMKYLTLNVHAASPPSDPTGPADQPSEENLPQTNNLLSNMIAANNTQFLYSPSDLFDQRMNTNMSGSWYTVDQQRVPDSAYFELSPATDYSSTPDGWPSESYVEFAKAKRLLAGFGSVDSSMSGYDLSGDYAMIFPEGYLYDIIDVDFTSDGDIADGCFYNPSISSIETSNSSWAIDSVGGFSDDADSVFNLTLAESRNLADCGITPILNTTLGNKSADVDYEPYKAFVVGTVWAWDTFEPKNSTSDPAESDSSTANRCAVLNATSDRWQAHDCDIQHHAACRVRKEPYIFRISDDRAAYGGSTDACRGDTTFSAPRTSLENNYLINDWHSYRADHDIEDELLWVDFNDLNSATCWVIGENATCPYQPTTANSGREIVVPTVAAVVVFVIALLLIFVKCAANRRNTLRRRKRGNDGWDYEGVPS